MSVVDGFTLAFTALAGRMADATRMGVGEAVNQLMTDANRDAPATPLDEGTLRGSAACFVDGTLIAVAQAQGGKPKPLIADPAGGAPSEVEIVGSVLFHSPYAAYQHEGQRADGSRQVQEYQHSGTGAKFLERKIVENGAEYIEVVADRVKGAMGNA